MSIVAQALAGLVVMVFVLVAPKMYYGVLLLALTIMLLTE